jgi:hypothetical protein
MSKKINEHNIREESKKRFVDTIKEVKFDDNQVVSIKGSFVKKDVFPQKNSDLFVELGIKRID